MLEALDQELVLRFFALKNQRARFKHGVDAFLTEYMEEVSDPESPLDFAYDAEEAVFRKTFDLLKYAFAEKAFAFSKQNKERVGCGLSMYHFEAITIGMQPIVPMLDPNDAVQSMDKFRGELTAIELDDAFAKITTGGGKNSPGLLKERIEFVEKRLGNAFT